MRKYNKIALGLLTMTLFATGLLSNKSDAYIRNSVRQPVRTEKLNSLDDYGTAENIDINLTSGLNPKDTRDRNIQMARQLAKRLKDYPKSVDITDLAKRAGTNPVSFRDNVIAYIEYANPDMYAFRGDCKFYVVSNPITGEIIKVTLEDIQYEETKEESKRVRDRVDQIVSQMPRDLTNAQKVLWVNNYIITNATYDHDAASNVSSSRDIYIGGRYTHAFTPYGVLLDKKGVCESYSKAFSMFMKRLGILSYRVRSDRMRHTWNIVNLNGKWYNIDLTWNDPSDSANKVSYSYFLKSDRQMYLNSSNSRNRHYEADEDIEKMDNTDRDKNVFGNRLVDAPVVIGNKFYYLTPDELNSVDNTMYLKEYDVNNNNVTNLMDKVEGVGYYENDIKYIFRFDPSSKKLDMYNMSDLKNPAASSVIGRLENLNIYEVNRKPVRMNSFKIGEAKKTDKGVAISLLEWNRRYNNGFVRSNSEMVLSIGSSESSEVTKPEESNTSESNVTEVREEEVSREEMENTDSTREGSRASNTVVEDRSEDYVNDRNRTTERSTSVERTTYTYDEIFSMIRTTRDYNLLVRIFNSVNNSDIHEVVLNRLKELGLSSRIKYYFFE